MTSKQVKLIVGYSIAYMVLAISAFFLSGSDEVTADTATAQVTSSPTITFGSSTVSGAVGAAI